MNDLLSGPLTASMMENLAKLVVDDQLVLFVGAGLSLQAKPKKLENKLRLPLWNSLADNVATRCGVRRTDYADIFDLFDAIVENQSRSALEEAVRGEVATELYDPGDAHKELNKIDWNMVVTTNYDDILDRSLNELSPVVNESDYEWLSRPAGRKPKLVHLHGSIKNPHTLAGSDYGNWNESHPRAYQFLESVVLNKTILFVGYSFSDPWLRFGLLDWLRKITGKNGKRHFAWMWDVNQEQVKLLDKRNSITVESIREDSDWALAFRQLQEAIQRLKTKKRPKRVAEVSRTASSGNAAIVNGYKLYYYRIRSGKSIKTLSQECGLQPIELNKLEQPKAKIKAGPDCFRPTSRDTLARIEHSLQAVGRLEYGQADDFLAKYIMFYKVNTTIGRKSNHTKNLEFVPDTKAVIFDFGGTLTNTSRVMQK